MFTCSFFSLLEFDCASQRSLRRRHRDGNTRVCVSSSAFDRSEDKTEGHGRRCDALNCAEMIITLPHSSGVLLLSSRAREAARSARDDIANCQFAHYPDTGSGSSAVCFGSPAFPRRRTSRLEHLQSNDTRVKRTIDSLARPFESGRVSFDVNRTLVLPSISKVLLYSFPLTNVETIDSHVHDRSGIIRDVTNATVIGLRDAQYRGI